MRRGPRTSRRAGSVPAGALAFGVVAGTDGGAEPEPAAPAVVRAAPSAPSAPRPAPSAAPETTAPAAKPAGGLGAIGYPHVPGGFPADPAPESLDRLTQGLHPARKLAV